MQKDSYKSAMSVSDMCESTDMYLVDVIWEYVHLNVPELSTQLYDTPALSRSLSLSHISQS